MQKNYQQILQNIKIACDAVNRNSKDICLIAVSKTHSSIQIREAYQLGIENFAESYVKEALLKQQELSDLPIIWHFIGPIQSNKIKLIAQNFSWVHSVDSLKIIDGLANHYHGIQPLNILLQINIDNAISKRGIKAHEALDFVTYIQQFSNLKLRGLMVIPDPVYLCKAFQATQELFNALNAKLTHPMEQLSMGMSQDYQQAIKYGATMIRIGTAIFGELYHH